MKGMRILQLQTTEVTYNETQTKGFSYTIEERDKNKQKGILVECEHVQ